MIGECHLEVQIGTYKIMGITIDRITEEDCKAVIEMTLGEEILGRHKTIEVRITKVDVETTILEEVEVGLGKDKTQVMSEGMTEAVVDQDQDQGLVQEPVHIEIGLDALNVENMTILLTIVQTQTLMKNKNEYSNRITLTKSNSI